MCATTSRTYTEQKIRDVGALIGGENRVTGDGGLDVLTGSDQPLVVRIFGQDPDVLEELAQRVRAVMADVPGVTEPQVDLPERQPTIEIEVDLDRAQSLGVSPGIVRRAAATLLQGIQVGSVFQEQKVFDVIVQGAPSTRGSIDDVRNLLIDRPDGGHVRLGEVADVRVADSPPPSSSATRCPGGSTWRPLSAVAAPARQPPRSTPGSRSWPSPSSTTPRCGPRTRRARSVPAGCWDSPWVQQSRCSCSSRPPSAAGGWPAWSSQRSRSHWSAACRSRWWTAAILSLGALVGLLAVLGLSTRTAVLFVITAQAREGEQTQESRTAAARIAAEERLAPVVTSTVATAVLVTPFVVLGSRPGLELLHPMAIALIGGLVTSTLVTLFVLPAIYARLGVGPEPVGPPPGAEEQVIHLNGKEAPGATLPGQRAVPVGVAHTEPAR